MVESCQNTYFTLKSFIEVENIKLRVLLVIWADFRCQNGFKIFSAISKMYIPDGVQWIG